MVVGVHFIPNRISEASLGWHVCEQEANRNNARILSNLFSNRFVFHDVMTLCCSNPWLLDVLRLCLQRQPKRRPAIGGPNGLLNHPFLQPQCVRAMQFYKEMTMESATMHETIRQIHESAGDARWKMEGIVPMVTNVYEGMQSDS